jgi:hypothetical protein
MSSIDSANGYTQPQKVQYVPPVRQKDQDTERLQAQQDQQRTRPPAVQVTLSPEAQKALAEQKAQTSQT